MSATKKPSKSNHNAHFFWESKSNKNRSRFNLLLLEFGEYLLEDLSAYYFPIPTTFEVKDALKIQGRLKLSTRSLIFEPGEARYPIIKFPYKNMPQEIEKFNLKPAELNALSVEVSGFFTFTCMQSFEMKENNKIAPYKMIDYSAQGGHRSVFALVHADLNALLVKIEQLRHILKVTALKGQGMGQTLLQPFIEHAQLWTLNFDTSLLVNFHEKMLFERPIAAKKIKPLIIQPGSIMVTESRVYFQPAQLNNIGDSVQHFEVRNIARIFRRRYLLRQTGIEFILTDNTSHLFVLDMVSIRDTIYNTLMNIRTLPTSARSGSNGVPGHLGTLGSGMSSTLEALCRKWQRREISNFEYLMLLNSEADRSVNDLTQYPVFPHIIADYTSKKLKLDSPGTFRDLSKPIGALNAERLQYFKQRLHSMPPQDPALGVPPPFLYGTHYSTPGYVLHYLVRVAPEYMLCLQNGKFDAPDRMFHNIASTWQSCLTNPTDLKELIPEFFTGSGEFLSNFDDLDLGHLYTGERLNDVVLPPWADSPRDFIKKHQKALECDYVSEHLHEWIDLIFGYKQTGPAALQYDNLYYYLTYEGAVDIDSITDMREKDGIIMQIQEFGQTPKQLFSVPHPGRNSTSSSVSNSSNGISGSSISGSNTSSISGGSSVQVIDVVTTGGPSSSGTSGISSGNSGGTSGTSSGDRPQSFLRRLSTAANNTTSTSTPTTTTAPINTTTITNTNNTNTTTTKSAHNTSFDPLQAQQQLEQLMISSERLLQETNTTSTTTNTTTNNTTNTTNATNTTTSTTNHGTSTTGGGRGRSGSNTSHASSVSTNTNINAGEDVNVDIVHLDDAFRQEVAALEAANNNNNAMYNATNNATNASANTNASSGTSGSGTSSGGGMMRVTSATSMTNNTTNTNTTNTTTSANNMGRGTPSPVSTQSSPGYPTTGKHMSAPASVHVQREKKPVDSLLGTVLNFFNAPAKPRNLTSGTTNTTINQGTLSGGANVSASAVNSAVLVPTPLPAVVEPSGVDSGSGTNEKENSSHRDTQDPYTTRSLRYSPSTPYGYFHNNPRRIVMCSSESYYWHSKAATGVCVQLYPETSVLAPAAHSSHASFAEVTHAIVATVARDANLKVSRVEQVVEGGFTRDGGLQVSVRHSTVTPRRSTAVSGSSLAAVILLNDKNHIVFASWDNNIYGYSVSHAHAMGKTYAHHDAVTCLSTDKSNKYLLSGSLDTTVKLWALNTTSSGSGSGSDGNLIPTKPIYEFHESDSPIQSVALDESGRLGAAGAEDGSVVVYDLKTKAVLYTVVVSPNNKRINCLKWLPENNAYSGLLLYTDEKLLCGTEDGMLVCLDRKGVVYCSTSTSGSSSSTSSGSSNGVCSIECDGRLIYAGCADGTIRCYVMHNNNTTSTTTTNPNTTNTTNTSLTSSTSSSVGSIVEVYKHNMAHSGRINALSFSVAGNAEAGHGSSGVHRYSAAQYTALLASAGEDCSVKLWRVYFSGDY